jgi:hypothetical protein
MARILAYGDNHYIVRGPLPDGEIALALIRYSSLIQIGTTIPAHLGQWEIITVAERIQEGGACMTREQAVETPGAALVMDASGRFSFACKKAVVRIKIRGRSAPFFFASVIK